MRCLHPNHANAREAELREASINGKSVPPEDMATMTVTVDGVDILAVCDLCWEDDIGNADFHVSYGCGQTREEAYRVLVEGGHVVPMPELRERAALGIRRAA